MPAGEQRSGSRKKSSIPTQPTRLYAATVKQLDEAADAFGMSVAEIAELVIRPALDKKLVDARKILAVRRQVMNPPPRSKSSPK